MDRTFRNTVSFLSYQTTNTEWFISNQTASTVCFISYQTASTFFMVFSFSWGKQSPQNVVFDSSYVNTATS